MALEIEKGGISHYCCEEEQERKEDDNDGNEKQVRQGGFCLDILLIGS